MSIFIDDVINLNTLSFSHFKLIFEFFRKNQNIFIDETIILTKLIQRIIISLAKTIKTNNYFNSNMEAKAITDRDLNKFKNIIEDNKKIYNIQQTLATTTEEVEKILIKLGDLLEELTQIKIDVDDVESRLHEKFELLNDKFDLFLDEIMKNQDLNSLVDILLKNPQFQERVMERILYNQKMRNKN